MPDKIHTRRAQHDDADLIQTVLCRSISEDCAADHGGDRKIIEQWLANKTTENIRNWIQSTGFVVVAEKNRAIVGVAMLRADGKIVLCYALSEVRHQGVGKAMLRSLEEEARRRHMTQIYLSSTKTAYDFYLRNGFSYTNCDEVVLGMTVRAMKKSLA